jgi:tetratricopeptide (TPR) repeat protein
MTSNTGAFIRGTLLLIASVGLVGWFIVRTIRRAEDPAAMVFKWIITALIVVFIVWKVAPLVGQGGYSGAFGGIPLSAVCGLGLAIIWRQHLANLVAKPLGSLYDGGDTPPEPAPAYSIAQARQKQGKYLEAIVEIRKQLDQFPTDLQGQMLLAQIQAEDLKDLPAAELAIQHLCAQPGHAPANLAFALYSMADWHLKYGRDRDAARRNFEQVIALLPDTEFALTAAQRIAHLGGEEMDKPKTFNVVEGARNIGLARGREIVAQPQQDPGLIAADLVKHLEKFPLDAEAREKLASLYADHYGRLDLATDQLEQLIQQPHRPGKLIVRWLNLLADIQIRCGGDYETVKETLQRIVDLDPKLAAAEAARNRIALLKLELKAKQEKAGVKMGVYEQNLGLKRGPARADD